MTIKQIKEEMGKYRDFYGGDLLGLENIEKCETKNDLAALIEQHRTFMEEMLADAHSHLDHFKKRLGLF